jgi:hypothetical protein
MGRQVAHDAGGVDEAGLLLAGVSVADEFHRYQVLRWWSVEGVRNA